ncbi:protein O-mannosyl-transferase 2-like isoform X1 [Stegodyphus dumicola]|uniref:protein O-mannosyl-transferase 2-like isoform X1 n=1 Tax=Stegodyphus dumicola TaxID=202533 RepID=UPI0015B0AF01|nr:protein O-mannosyl-transferase 2-like isoform X1 [Stegodyphus dumicola]
MKSDTLLNIQTDTQWWLVFGVLTLLAVGTRLYKIEEPDHVCWDETHFGKMGSWYINHTFFFDVHPPLGKMLIGLSGKLTGYNGTFAFNKPGDKYGDHKYLGMRLFCVFLGICIIPFSFLIVWELTNSLSASSLAAFFIIFDVGMITLSQYILLDPILMFFIIGSVLGMVKIKSHHNRPFSVMWWFWLSWTGIFMACSISVKFVGLFVVLLVGIHTLTDLWIIWGNLNIPIVQVLKHFAARVLCLILIPAVLYITFFYIHLKTLYKSGSGDGFFSSAFQSQLEGNSLYHAHMPRDVAYGAIVTLKNHRTGGGYLHSHWHLYPEGIGARQQQVTAYSHKDENNKWLIKKFDSEPDSSAEAPVELVKNGDLIRLEHVVTRRNLHSHKEVAPITKRHQQVSCYGENGTGDANDVWRLEIVGIDERVTVATVTSKFRIIHYLTGCALHSHSKQLPKWGYEQMEVTCNPNVRDSNNFWNIEDNYFPKLPNVSFEVYAPSFLERFLESHAVMFQGNSGLKPKEGEVTSRPWQWPINLRGQFFSGQQLRIYLLGNPVIWWGNLLLLVVFFIVKLCLAVQKKRGYNHSKLLTDLNEKTMDACIWLFLGWALHYLPFFAMSRVLYFHHYFPALIFNSMLSAVIVDYILKVIFYAVPEVVANTFYHIAFGTIFSVLVYSFVIFSPLAYGLDNSTTANVTTSKIKWLDSWEF